MMLLEIFISELFIDSRPVQIHDERDNMNSSYLFAKKKKLENCTRQRNEKRKTIFMIWEALVWKFAGQEN